MTTAPERVRSAATEKRRRTPSAKTAKPPDPVSYCGCCAGWGEIWCDGCCGFNGCALCRWTYKRPCPVCVGGDAERIRW